MVKLLNTYRTYMNLEGLLKSTGKRCFENCYKIAAQKGDNLTIDDLLANDEKLIGTKETGLRTRLSCIKRIFRANLQNQALKMAQSRRR